MSNRRGRNSKSGNNGEAARAVETGGESRLAQWSRRKAAARVRASIPEEEAITDGQAQSEKVEEPVVQENELTDKDMPPLESLDEHSDYSAFLSPRVSEKLRRQALRKLFHLDVYNFADGLDDYAEDYTKFAALGNILTSDLRLQQQRAIDAAKEQVMADDSQGSKGEFPPDDAEAIEDDFEGPVGNDQPEDPSPNEDQA